MPNPQNAGPNADGSQSLAKESKAGLAVTAILTILATGAVTWLTNLDTSAWSGWWVNVAVVAISTVIGLLTAWLKKNR